MTKSTHLLLPLCMGAMLALGACATAPKAEKTAAAPEKTAEMSEKMTKAETAKEVADGLSQTKRTKKSADGEMICKRTTVVGSKFHKKVCATADEWAARAETDKKTTNSIQRSAGPGVTN